MECIHGMTQEFCSYCTGRMGDEAPGDTEAGRKAFFARRNQKPTNWIVAQFKGECAGCGFDYVPGEMIARALRDVEGWVGPCCPELA